MIVPAEIIRGVVQVLQQCRPNIEAASVHEKLLIAFKNLLDTAVVEVRSIDLVVQPIKSNCELNADVLNQYMPLYIPDNCFFIEATDKFKYMKIGKLFELHHFTTGTVHLVNGSVKDSAILLKLNISNRN